MYQKNRWLGFFLLLFSSSLWAQEARFEKPYFYLGAALGNSVVAPQFNYSPAATQLQPFREGQYLLRLFGGYTWHQRQGVELSLEAIPHHSGAQIPLRDGLAGKVIERSNAISLNASYLWRAFQWGSLALQLGPHLGLAATLEDRGPVGINSIAYPDFGTVPPFIELSADMQRRVFVHLGGRINLEWSLGKKKYNVLFLTGGLHYSPSILQRYRIRYRPVEGAEQQAIVETNLRNGFLGIGLRHCPSKVR